MQTPGAWAVPLSDPLCTDAGVTGGKAAALAWLHSEGLPVPDAFIIPVTVFTAHCPDATPERTPARPTINPELRTTLARICASLAPESDDRLVVRSSALGEDGATASFAGAHATYYYVDADSIGKAVVDCWLSLWSEPAQAYRRLRSSGSGFGMAVIIQRMVQSERSGVCFTRDPTGARPDCAVLESSWGLGAALVDGRVSPDRFLLDDEGAIAERRIARKRLKVAEHLRDPSHQRLEPVPLRLQSEASLTDIEAGQIVAMARRIADLAGSHQDMEWAIDGDELFVLQSRPLTTAPPAAPIRVDGRWVLFKPTAENFSEPFTPMTVDLLRRVLPPFGRFIHGRFYVNADLLAALLPWSLDDDTLTDVLMMRRLPESVRVHWRHLLRMAGLLGFGYLCAGATWHRTARIALDSLEGFEARCRAVVEDTDVDPLAALSMLILNRHTFRPMGENAVLANLASVRYFVLIEVLNRLLGKLAPDFDPTKLALLVSGGNAMLSQQMVEGIRSLANVARSDEDFCRALQGTSTDLQSIVVRLGEYHPFTLALDEFMRRFGHRAVRELDLMSPRWREDNTAVLAMVRNFVRLDGSARLDSHGLQLAAEDELHQALRRRWQRRLVDGLVRRIRYYVTLRENSRHYHTMVFAAVRLKLKALEQSLIETGRLRCEDDIFFLEYPEALALQAGSLGWLEVEPRIRARRIEYQARSRQRPPEAFNLQLRPRAPAADADVLTGDCACPGVATGIARVIHDPTIAAELTSGEILIAPYTDPAWTPLFPGAAAIIVEVGSYLSHAGTVAREYQVPCLVDVQDCTRRIRTGARLKVNATEGWVEIVS
ncbi:MAG: PEP/pyruvate-binding domain-containing protein [Pseudomonadales bacterium]